MFKNQRFVLIIGMLFIIAASTGCAKKGTGTTITSSAYNSPVASLRFMDWLVPSAVATTSTITDIKLCVTEFKLEGPDGSEASDVKDSATGTTGGDDKNEDISKDKKIGLVDLGDGTKTVDWGAASLPAGTVVKEMKIEIHHDQELCGVAYSASINGQTITKDLELHFNFASGKTLDKTDQITVALTNLVAKLTLAAQAGQLDDSHIEAYLDGSFKDDAH